MLHEPDDLARELRRLADPPAVTDVPPVHDLIVNPDTLHRLYGHLPDLSGDLRVRSANLSPYGPTLTLRVDVPGFPEHPPRAWADAGADAVQCHLAFLAAENITLSGWTPPAVGRLTVAPASGAHRVRLTFHGRGAALSFDCADQVTVGHISAYRRGPDGTDDGPHLFLSAVDARRHTTLPDPDERTFYGR